MAPRLQWMTSMKRAVLLSVFLFSCGSDPENGFGTAKQKEWLQGDVYYVQPGIEKFPDVATMTVSDTVYAKTLDVPPTGFTAGFAGDRIEWFAIRYHGTFDAKASGEYQFHILSDDGALVYVDGNLVIDNDGLHSPIDKTGKIPLEAGPHELRVDYFQGPRYEVALQLWATPPGGAEGLVTKSF